MIQELELSDMDTEDTSDFDNTRDDWQDELRGADIPSPTIEGIFLLLASVTAVMLVVAFVFFEAWRIINGS